MFVITGRILLSPLAGMEDGGLTDKKSGVFQKVTCRRALASWADKK
jgi:hypothetical protein